MQILFALSSTYLVLIFVRVILSWFRMAHTEKIEYFIGRFTDPYLNLFRRVLPLRIGFFDFSPIFGIMIISIIVSISGTLAKTGYISLGQIGSIVLQYTWSPFSFFLDFLVILMIIRLISTLSERFRSAQIFYMLDQYLYTVTGKILGFFTKKPVAYQTALIIASLVVIFIRVTVTIGVKVLALYLENL